MEIDSDDSENIPLSLTKPRKISPSELHFSIGDKTTKIVYNKKNVARKTIMRKTKEPRQTLAPQWNIIPDGTITGFSPHTITIDTPRRKNTVIRKNDIAIATETKPLPPPEPKPRLIHKVACKTVGEYKRNQEKIRKFYLEEEKAAKATTRTSSLQGPSSSNTQIQQSAELKPKQAPTKKSTPNRKPKVETNWSIDKLVKLATKNQRRQQEHRPYTHKTPTGTTKKKLKQSTPKLSFNYKAQQADLLESANLSQMQPVRNQSQQSQDESASNRSFLIFNVDIPPPNIIQTHLIDTEEPGQPQHVIHTSNEPSDFMVTSPESPPITSSTQPAPCGERNVFGTIHDILSRSTKRIDNAMKKIKSNINNSTETSNVDQSQIDYSAIISIKKPEMIYLDSSNSSKNYSNMDCDQVEPQSSHAALQTEPKNKSEQTPDIDETSLQQNSQSDPIKSPPNSSIYRTPPSSIRSDSISDLNEEDIIELNKIP